MATPWKPPAELLQRVREAADGMDVVGRTALLRDLAREIYDSEKFHGAGGLGADGRDSIGRQQIGDVLGQAESCYDAIEDAYLRDR